MKKNINKHIMVGVLVIGCTLLISKGIYADEMEEAIKAYLNDPTFDLLGHRYEKILFDNIASISDKGWSNEELLAKLQFVATDLKTIPLQVKCSFKIFEQNAIIYGSVGGIYGAKMSMGAKAFNKLVKIVFKSVVKF